MSKKADDRLICELFAKHRQIMFNCVRHSAQQIRCGGYSSGVIFVDNQQS